MVLSVEADKATIGLRPKKLAGGKLSADRQVGVIPLSLAKWARKSRGKGRLGPQVKQMSDVLSVGDVVYAASTRQGDQYHLVQMPAIEGALVAMDPHTGRVLALVGGFSYGKTQFNRAVQAKRQAGSSIKHIV